MDVTTIIMPLVARLSSLGYCYRDGMIENSDKLSDEQKERKIEKLPSFMELFSYCSYPGGCIIGPFFEYADYINFVELKGRYAVIPYSLFSSFRKFGDAILFMILALFFMEKFPVYYLGTIEFSKHSFLYKNVYLYFAMAGARYKLYSAFYYADGAVVMSGLSYNGLDEKGNSTWDRIVPMNGYSIETGTNMREMIDDWNHQIASWLRHYVFNRLKMKFPNAMFFNANMTMMMSAFWHGFYFTYYIFFIFMALGAEATKEIYRARHLFRWIPKPILPIILHFASLHAINV